MSSSFKIKPLAVAVSALLSVMSSYQAQSTPTSIVVSTSTSDLTFTTIDYPDLGLLEINSTGTINGSVYGINTSTTIGTLNNFSTIASSEESIYNTGTIGTLTNMGTITGVDDSIHNQGSIGTLTNAGVINSSEDAGIWNDGGVIDYLNNTGTISGDAGVVYEYGSSGGTLTNSGLISGGVGVVVADGATLDVLNNNGTISGEGFGIGLFSDGCYATIGTLSNSGLITGGDVAIINQFSELGNIFNEGTIAGNIFSTTGLSFYGPEGEGFGILTGYESNGMGTISITGGDLVFVTGNMLLNDNIALDEGNMSLQAANLLISNVISLNGDYQQGSEANLIFGMSNYQTASADLTTYNGYGRLLISGTATLASGSSVSLSNMGNYAFADGQRYVLMQAATDGTNYNVESLNYNVYGYNGLVTGSTMTDTTDSTKTDLVVTLGNSGPNNQATRPDAVAALGGLFNYGGTNAALLDLFNAGAALGSTAAANRAGAQLSPAAIASASAQASALPGMSVLNVLAQRGEAIRLAGGGGTGLSTGENDEGPVAWGQGFGGKVNRGNQSDVSGYDGHFVGMLLGSDGAVGDRWRLGGLGSYTTTMVDSTGDNQGSSAHVKSYGLFAYANYEGKPWYANLTAGNVWHHYNTKRDIAFSGFSGDAAGSFKGNQYLVSGLMGYPLQLGMMRTTLTPIAALTYSNLRQDGYTESGGNGAGLTVNGVTSTSLKSDLAMKVDHRFKVSNGEVRPFAQLGWRHEYHTHALQSVANFSADSSGATSFVTRGSKPVVDTGVLSVGATVIGQHNLSLTVKYTGEAARHYQSHTGNLQLRWQF